MEKRYCKYHNVYKHWTTSCLCFSDMIHKAMDEEGLKFEEKLVKVDTNPFQVHTNYAKPIQILMVGAFIDKAKSLDDFEKKGENVFPPARDTLLDLFMQKKKRLKK